MARGAPLLAAAMVLAGLSAAAQPPAGDRIVLPMPWAASPGWAGTGVPPKIDPKAAALPGQEPIPGHANGWSGVPAIDCGRDLPCGVRLQGLVGKNSGIFVEGTAFTW